MQALQALNLEDTKLGPRGLVVICESLLTIKNLKSLSLSDNDIGPSGLQGYRRCCKV